jgi:hypothetical protein
MPSLTWLMALKTPRETVDGRESLHGETVVREARSPHHRKAPAQSRPGTTASGMKEKTYPRGLDNSGNIERNSNGLFHRPRPSPRAPQPPSRWCARPGRARIPPRQRWASPAGHRQAAGRLTRRSSLVLGERQQAATAWGRGESAGMQCEHCSLDR